MWRSLLMTPLGFISWTDTNPVTLRRALALPHRPAPRDRTGAAGPYASAMPAKDDGGYAIH